MRYAVGDDDIPVYYDAPEREYSVAILDGGNSHLLFEFCPFCGAALPPSVRIVRLDRLRAFGFEGFDDDIPAEYESDEWWRREVGDPYGMPAPVLGPITPEDEEAKKYAGMALLPPGWDDDSVDDPPTMGNETE
jgi:hypothetical protein